MSFSFFVGGGLRLLEHGESGASITPREFPPVVIGRELQVSRVEDSSGGFFDQFFTSHNAFSFIVPTITGTSFTSTSTV